MPTCTMCDINYVRRRTVRPSIPCHLCAARTEEACHEGCCTSVDRYSATTCLACEQHLRAQVIEMGKMLTGSILPGLNAFFTSRAATEAFEEATRETRFEREDVI